MKGCVDEGVLQAYADGELPAESAARVAAHLAACERCASAARAAAEESAAFASAFSVTEPLHVPTERLRASIADAIAEAELARATNARAASAAGAHTAARADGDSIGRDFVSGNSASGNFPSGDSAGGSIGARLRRLASGLAAGLSPRQAASFAGLALAALLAGTIFYTLTQKRGGPAPGGEIASGATTPTPSASQSPQSANQSPQSASPSADSQGAPADGGGVSESRGTASPSPATNDVAAGQRSKKRAGIGEQAKIQPRGGPVLDRGDGRRGAKPAELLLPVEREYQSEIASLKSAIERRGVTSLSPTLRAEYERSLAVVDQAIVATRDAARSNPQDADAQEFLRTAYRDKLDLLSTVADRAQLAGLEH